MNDLENQLYTVKTEITKALMFGQNIDNFLYQLILIEEEIGNIQKCNLWKKYYFQNKDNIIKNKTLLSVAMIVKNEESSLAKTLQSIKNIADEIIIVDTGSIDNTIEIAKSYGADVYHFKWINDFAAARNYAIDKCNGEWILYIDADEFIDEFTINSIRQILQNSSENTGAYMMEILSHGLDENGKLFDYSGFYPRLFRNCGFPLIYFFGKIHEQIAPSIINLDLDIMQSKLKIIHEGYILNQEEMNKKVKNNLNILIQHIKDEPQNGYTWYQLGNTFFQMKDEQKAEELLINAIKCGNLSKFLQSNTNLVLATICLHKNDIEQAKYFAHESLNLYPKNNTGAKAILQKIS